MSHALLSPSAAHRWLNCPPSARLEETFPDNESEAAAEGTLAHSWAEVTLKYFLQKLTDAEFHKTLETLKKSKFYSNGLEDYVSVYVDTVIDKFHKARSVDAGAALYLEQKFNLQAFVPNSYGYADAVILSNGTMEIVDLKYGAGVPVKAKNNPQLRLYALGAYLELSFLYKINAVTVTIVQPRNGGISSETLTIEELLNWAEQVKPIAQLAFKGEGEFKAGEHCKFCRAANQCKTLADYYYPFVKEDFDNPNLLTDDELSNIVIRSEDIIKWLNNVKAYVLKEALNGKHWKGLKIVEGRSVRKISDENKAAKILKANGGTDEQIWKPKELFGFIALEKNFGKKNIAEWLQDVIQKPAGAPTLVLETDPRPEWHKVESEFDKLER